jgi:2-methylfumaryl-CoA isomerase
VTLALSDVAYSLVSNLGFMGEAEIMQRDRPAIGNHLYGAFGHNLPTSDGRQLMLVALTNRHWKSLVEITGTADEMSGIEKRDGLDLYTDAGRYEAREDIVSILSKWSKTKTLSEVGALFDATKILWGPYQSFQQMVQSDPRASLQNPMFEEIEQEGIGRIRASGSPLNFVGKERKTVRPASPVGADTAAVIGDLEDGVNRSDD